MKQIIAPLIASLLLQSCDSNGQIKNQKQIVIASSNNKTQMITDTTDQLNLSEISRILKDQERVESDEIEQTHPYVLTDSDLTILFPIVKIGLKNQGFTPLPTAKFRQIMADKLNCDYKDLPYLSAKYFTDEELCWTKNADYIKDVQLPDYGQFIVAVFGSCNFILEMRLLNQYIKLDNRNYTITIPLNIVNRNKYLFNEDKSTLPWLWVNDNEFMNSLVKLFGYTTDKTLLKLVLEQSPYVYNDKTVHPNDLGRILWNKSCSRHFTMNENSFDLIAELTTPDNPEWLAHLSDYMFFLSLNNTVDLTMDEKSRLLCKILNFGESIITRNEYKGQDINKGSPRFKVPFKDLFLMNFISSCDGDLSFEKRFEANNFYNIPGFKEQWHKVRARYDELHKNDDQ